MGYGISVDQATIAIKRTNTIEEQSALLAGWNQHYCQLSPGAFSGTLSEAHLPHAYLFRESTNCRLLQRGFVGPDVLAVGIPLTITGPAQFCGSQCRNGQLHIFSGRDGFEFYTPSGLDIVGVVVPRADVFGGLDDDAAQSVVSRLTQAHLMDIAPSLFQNLANTLLSRSVAVDDITALLADALLSDVNVTPPSRHHNLSMRLREIVMDLTWDQPPDIPQICGVLGISRRTLQYALQRDLGMRPVEYMRALRLNAARACILRGASVTSAATQAGFWHLGRFSQDYRALFNENPSATRYRS
jgi:AraC family ethanolamine operon transcriptional activator